MSTTTTAPAITTSGGSLKIPANALRYNTSSSQDAPHWSTAAEAFSNAQSQIDNLNTFARKLSAFVTAATSSNFPATGLNYLSVNSGNVSIDLSLGDVQYLVLPASAPTILAPIYSGVSMSPGMRFTLVFVEDATGNRPLPSFTGGAGGFASSTQSQIQIDPSSNTCTVIRFVALPGIIWVMETLNVTGGTIS